MRMPAWPLLQDELTFFRGLGMQEHFSGYHYKDHPSAVRFILFYTIPK